MNRLNKVNNPLWWIKKNNLSKLDSICNKYYKTLAGMHRKVIIQNYNGYA